VERILNTGTLIRPAIKRFQTCESEARAAVRAFHAGVHQPDAALVIFFCSNEYDLDALAEEMRACFKDVPVVGCTTAGEIGPAGYRTLSLTGASLPASQFEIVAGRIDRLQQFERAAGRDFAKDLVLALEKRAPEANGDNSFGLLLIDGLSVREESVTRAFQNALGHIPLVGGSAGDGLRFATTQVYCDGAFHGDSAVLVLASTPLPIKLFKTQHFVATDRRMVVTDADSDRRIVREINGLPAAEEYSRILGIDPGELEPSRFAAWPVVVMIDGTNYVRAIQKANPDGSLTFFCAIENGLVLRVAKGVDLLQNLDEAFAAIRVEVGPPQLVIGCDCILRKLEIAQSPVKERISELLERNKLIGFATYGEQFNGVHINQTLVGIAIGGGREVGNG
jgi:hypothetical protein